MDKKKLSYIDRYSREHFRIELDCIYKSIEEPYSHFTSIVMVEYKGVRYMYDCPDPGYYLFDYAKSPLKILTHGYLRLNKIGIPNDFICHKDFGNMLYDDISTSADDIIIKAMLYKDLLGYHPIVLTKEIIEKCSSKAQRIVDRLAMEVIHDRSK